MNTPRLNGAWKVVAAIVGTAIPLIIGAVLAFGGVRSDMTGLRRDVDRKASQETVQLQYEALLREIQNINRRLDRWEASR